MAKKRGKKFRSIVRKGGSALKREGVQGGIGAFAGGYAPELLLPMVPMSIPKNLGLVIFAALEWLAAKKGVAKNFSGPAFYGTLGSLGSHVKTGGLMGRPALSVAQLESLRGGSMHRPALSAMNRPAMSAMNSPRYAGRNWPRATNAAW